MLFGVPALIAFVSRICTLVPGDLFFTGTPACVGLATKTFLRDGDVVTTRIEGLGELRNRCVRMPNWR
jgi:2-keto-4-pentenoate hydratase/2-oxohepta-3-ene-1,7-dioic acid hydratase in catechol pathway